LILDDGYSILVEDPDFSGDAGLWLLDIYNGSPLFSFSFKFDEFVKSQKAPVIVIPANAGIQGDQSRRGTGLPLSWE
jgi:hypothetical protein